VKNSEASFFIFIPENKGFIFLPELSKFFILHYFTFRFLSKILYILTPPNAGGKKCSQGRKVSFSVEWFRLWKAVLLLEWMNSGLHAAEFRKQIKRVIPSLMLESS